MSPVTWIPVNESLPRTPWADRTTVVPVPVPQSKHEQCPACASADVRWGGETTTLIGGDDGTPDGDPNHRHRNGDCRACGLTFERHAKRANVWYMAAGRVVLGWPSCFESFPLPCQCGGTIRRRYTAPDGVSEVTSLGYSADSRTFRIFWACDGACAWRAESRDDYWRPERKP